MEAPREYFLLPICHGRDVEERFGDRTDLFLEMGTELA